MKQIFVLFSKKHKNPILNCFYCIVQYHHLQNHTIINCDSYYGIIIWRERNIPHLRFRSVVQFTLKWQSLARMPTANREVYVHALLVQHLYSVFFQYMVWYGPISETAWMQRRQKKNWLKYTDFTELKKTTSGSYSNCSNYSSLFFKSFKFRCCSFYFIAVNIEYAAYFTFSFIVQFSKENSRGGFWLVLLFFEVGFVKRVIFLVGSNYINTVDNYERLIDLLRQISKLSNFNVLGLADFMIIPSFLFLTFVLMQSHTCACNMSFVSSFVIYWQFRRIDHNGSHKPYLFFLLSNCTYNQWRS